MQHAYDAENVFKYHAPKDGQSAKYQNLRDAARELTDLMTLLCPESRELSLARTNLEQATFWANAAIARNE